jgi:hypothetical protein
MILSGLVAACLPEPTLPDAERKRHMTGAA